ncbi:MAG: hypothetical protein PHF66_04450 [Desulfobacteraceae bacterium]|jgi:hypothetical protein|nr:hypothetical protein [Desulfobacteraceae bacterium]MDD3992863.1 hypothetical protein [Desulfobacteraceae bacterium]
MKQYVIDQIRPEDQAKLKVLLETELGPPAVGGIYWLPLEASLWTEVQVAHKDCQPFYVAVDLEADRLVCELLVRTRDRMHCECMGYATAAQRAWLIEKIDGILQQLHIMV